MGDEDKENRNDKRNEVQDSEIGEPLSTLGGGNDVQFPIEEKDER